MKWVAMVPFDTDLSNESFITRETYFRQELKNRADSSNFNPEKYVIPLWGHPIVKSVIEEILDTIDHFC